MATKKKYCIPQRLHLAAIRQVKEQNYIKSKNDQTVAGMWAVKEAVSKAVGTSFTGFVMKDIEILHNENGRPYALQRSKSNSRKAENQANTYQYFA